MVTPDQLAGLVAQFNEIIKRVVNGSLKPNVVKRALQDIIENKHTAALTEPSWWVLPHRQLERVMELSDELGWGFTEANCPAVPQNVGLGEGEVLMLDVKLPEKSQQPGLHRTFDELWQLIEAQEGYTQRRSSTLKATAELLRQVPGYTHDPGIRWVAFNPTTYQGLSPAAALEQSQADGVKLAGTEVLMAALLFPKWVTSLLTDHTPAPNMPGLQFYWIDQWSSEWRCVPYFIWLNDEHELVLDTHWAKTSVPGWASPTVRVLS